MVDPGGYQIETFFKKQRAFAEQEFWFLPAHNPGGRVELTLGGYAVNNSIDGNSRAVIGQAKTLPPGGIGSEISFTGRVIGIVEAYGERGTRPTLHGGIRYWAVPNRVQIDTTVGEERGSPAKRFYTVGMRLLF